MSDPAPPRLAPVDAADPSGAASDRDPRRRLRLGDLVVIGSIPVVLGAGFLLPSSVVDALVLTGSNGPASSFATHFLHRSPGHLFGNLLAYVVVASLGYALSALAGRRDVFRAAFVTFVVALPVVLSALVAPATGAGTALGFSGLVLAFVGYLPIAVVAYLASRIDGVAVRHAGGLFLLGLAIVAVRTVPDPAIRWPIAAAATLGAAPYFLPLARSTIHPRRGGAIDRSGLVGGSLVAFLFVALAAFPADPAGEAMVESYVHLLGYALGFLAPYLATRILDTCERTSAIPGGQSSRRN